MKEFTEIKIINPSRNIDSILEIDKFIAFSFKDDELKRLIGGKPVSKLEDARTIKFSTQGHYEGVCLSQVKPGVELELFDNWKKENRIAEGIITRRYFEKTTKEDWSIEEEINPLNCKLHKIEISLSNEEKRYLDFGNIPIQMEDKWFSFTENNVIRFFRSWTGIEIFQAEISQVGDNKWMIEEFQSTTDHNFTLLNRKSIFKDLIKFLIRRIEEVMK